MCSGIRLICWFSCFDDTSSWWLAEKAALWLWHEFLWKPETVKGQTYDSGCNTIYKQYLLFMSLKEMISPCDINNKHLISSKQIQWNSSSLENRRYVWLLTAEGFRSLQCKRATVCHVMNPHFCKYTRGNQQSYKFRNINMIRGQSSTQIIHDIMNTLLINQLILWL